MKKFKLKNKELRVSGGFTLVELLLYLGIFTIFLTVTLQMFSSIFEIQVESEAVSSVNSDGRYIVQRFSYDINRASEILTPSEFGTTSATLILVIDGQNYIYSLDSGNLILENQSLTTFDQLNSTESAVLDLSFIKLDGGGKDAVQMTFSLTSEIKRKGVDEIKTFKTSAGLR
jgi:type II secretory pathway pseudopilin PulG